MGWGGVGGSLTEKYSPKEYEAMRRGVFFVVILQTLAGHHLVSPSFILEKSFSRSRTCAGKRVEGGFSNFESH